MAEVAEGLTGNPWVWVIKNRLTNVPQALKLLEDLLRAQGDLTRAAHLLGQKPDDAEDPGDFVLREIITLRRTRDEASEAEKEAREVEELLRIDRIAVEIGYRLIGPTLDELAATRVRFVTSARSNLIK